MEEKKSSVLSLEKVGSLRMFTYLFPYLNPSSLEKKNKKNDILLYKHQTKHR